MRRRFVLVALAILSVGLVAVVQTDSGILGVSGADDQDEMLSRLDSFIT